MQCIVRCHLINITFIMLYIKCYQYCLKITVCYHSTQNFYLKRSVESWNLLMLEHSRCCCVSWWALVQWCSSISVCEALLWWLSQWGVMTLSLSKTNGPPEMLLKNWMALILGAFLFTVLIMHFMEVVRELMFS